MAKSPTQTNRVASLKTELGPDVLVVTRFVGHEGLNELFEFEVEALSDRKDIDFDTLLGTPCCLTVKVPNDGRRYFHGLLALADWNGDIGYRQGYRLVLRPWPWFLTHKKINRIFHNKSVPQILQEVLDESGLGNHKLSLSGDYPEREYMVQYNETDLEFVLRLMEDEGIYYFFEHTADKHVMVMVDDMNAHTPVPTCKEIVYIPTTDPLRVDTEHLNGWTVQRRFTSGKVTVQSHDYRKPGQELKKDSEKPRKHRHGSLEVFDWDHARIEPSESETAAKRRLEALQAADRRRHAVGTAPSLTPGFKTTLARHPATGENRSYLVLSCEHDLRTQAYRSTGEAADDAIGYEGRYQLYPDDKPYRWVPRRRKERIEGCQIGVVVGEKGEEIDVDEHGRIQVMFPWMNSDHNSRRCRVLQVWAAKGWGGMFIPRIGMDVIVQFQNGDPDYPIVIGCLYNYATDVPYKLPDKKNIAGIKSHSTKNGGEEDYNEFILDDTKGTELIRLHAEKDLHVEVENTETRTIDGEAVSPRGEASRTTTIKKGDEIYTLEKGDRSETIGEGDDDLLIKMGNRHCEISMGNDDLEIKVGNRTTKISLGSDSVEAMQSITLTVASSKMTIDPSGITLDAPMIKLNGQAMVDVNAPLTKVNGSGMTKITGGVVMIN